MTAAIKVDRAVGIVTRLPGTLHVLRRGDLDLGRVLAIAEATAVLDADQAAKVEAVVLPGAPDQTAGELRAALRRAVIAVDPAAAEQRRKQAVKDRTVDQYQTNDGTSVLRAVLSAIDTGEIYDLVDEVARRTKTTNDPANPDTRTMDARRADALVFLLLGRDPHLGPQDPPPPPPGPTSGPATGQVDPDPDDDPPPVPDEPADLDDRFPPEPDHRRWHRRRPRPQGVRPRRPGPQRVRPGRP